MCGVSDERCTRCMVVRRLLGSGMVGFWVLLRVPLFLSFMAMPDQCFFLCVTLTMPPQESSECKRTMQYECL